MNVSTATTKELVEFYNAHSDKPVTRFADRKTAERRVAALIDSSVTPAKTPREINQCPSCGKKLDQTPAGLEGTAGAERNFCHRCGTEYYPETGRIYNAPAPSANRAAAIRQTWANPKVAAARSERSHVIVHGTEHRSVLAAFKHLGLPVSKHIVFRGQLKAAGKLTFAGHVFSVVKA